MSDRRGMTAVDAVLVLATLVLLLGMAIPMVGLDLSQSDTMEAQHATVAIADGIFQYRKDACAGPGGLIPRTPAAVLVGPGEVPAFGMFPDGVRGDLYALLCSGDGVGYDWNGPFLDEVRPDPWGRAYVVFVGNFDDPRGRPWVLSAGPNGVLDTRPESLICGGDDMGYVVRAPRSGLKAPVESRGAEAGGAAPAPRSGR